MIFADAAEYEIIPEIGADGGEVNVAVHQTNNFSCEGTGDPHAAARMVASHQDRNVKAITRNLIGAALAGGGLAIDGLRNLRAERKTGMPTDVDAWRDDAIRCGLRIRLQGASYSRLADIML